MISARVAYNAVMDDEQLAEGMRTVGEAAFMEDKVALENIEELIARDNRPNLKEKFIQTEEAGFRVLRPAGQEQQEMQEVASAG